MPIRRLSIIESTLREGEQFAGAHFTLAQRRQIAHAVDDFGVEHIELTTPVASPTAQRSCREIAALPLRAIVLTHTRCVVDDVLLAIDCGVGGVDLLFGTSSWLRSNSHGLELDDIVVAAADCIALVRAAGLEVRFSCEDSFRTEPADLLRILAAVAALGVDRVGLADTVGIATPAQVTALITQLRDAVDCDIEFHAHNDNGCAVANALAALQAGATHIDTTVLGIGERNGIVPLSGLIARLHTVQPELVDHYALERLAALDAMVAGILDVDIPLTAPITSPYAFHHKAGMHTKAVLGDPRSYEPFAPERFGIERRLLVNHQLVGRHAVRQRAAALGIAGDDTWLRRVTAEVKRHAGERLLRDDEVDALLRASAGA
ncbi:MAG: homocitrate synthase [Candidatus Dormibacteraeota bacterium]|uniref:Homocitrate synthase n=1 Tax=Candidatus Amunia macphersoniae TaxID=3127014 RepID=A0A934KHR8_9BACT|nr:homocitrate synthase [Candidatus Dormibacteraeota bacterium]